MIAALYVDPKGCYSTVADIDIWDKIRDARLYKGPYPVVAHPPCNLWTRFAHVNYARWGGEHNRPGNDGGCFYHALRSVRRFGGVLEHPAFSDAWEKYSLVKPKNIGWIRVNSKEWVCEIWQSAYGHKARKRTWLFYCGNNVPHELRWERKEGTHQIGGYCRKSHNNKPTIRGKAASATPIEFRDDLILLARKSNAKD